MSDIDLDVAVGAVLAKHQARYDSTGWSCLCGHRYGKPQNVALATEAHRLEMTVVATREQVAEEIEAVDPVEWALAGQSAGADAARIARGDS